MRPARAPSARAKKTECSIQNFRVHGTEGCAWWMLLCFRAYRGSLSSAAVYMIGEKAADAILADA